MILDIKDEFDMKKTAYVITKRTFISELCPPETETLGILIDQDPKQYLEKLSGAKAEKDSYIENAYSAGNLYGTQYIATRTTTLG